MAEREQNGRGDVVIRQYRNVFAEATAVADKIEALIEAGVEPREIIVLTQRRAFATPIFRLLRDRDVPVKSYYAEAALGTPAAQERFAILKLYLNNEDRVALRWLLGLGDPRWRAKSYRRVIDSIRETGNSPWVTMCAIAAGTLRIPYTGRLIERFAEITTQLETLDSAENIDDFIQTWLPDNPDTELLAETVESLRDDVVDAAGLFSTLYETITQPEVPLEVEEVRIMSLHKSKGLSSPYVFIAGCVEGLLPSQPERGTSQAVADAQLQEDRRLFYVGITRVKASLPNRPGYLGLTFSQRMPAADAFNSQITPVRIQGNTAILQPSRFIGEMTPHIPAAEFNQPL